MPLVFPVEVAVAVYRRLVLWSVSYSMNAQEQEENLHWKMPFTSLFR